MQGVTLDGIVKRYGAAQVVHGIDLEVRPGEFLVLVGPSGCGKSTTLRMVAGLEEISDGVLTIDGRVMNRVAPKDRDVAMVFQNYALYPHLSVAENIAFGLRIRRTPRAEADALMREVAGILELTEYLDRRPADLSGGQRQRVAMGRAIVRHPKVFLFDEPLSNLDAKLRAQMRAEIKRLHARLGATSIYVTHDQVEAMTLADRIVVMRDGRIEQVGAPMDLFEDPANLFVAGFIGSPPMNQVEGVVEGGDVPHAVIGGQRLRLPPLDALRGMDGRPVVVGIRPEFAVPSPRGAGALALEVDLVEPLGSEALVHARLGDAPFVVRAETHGGLDRVRALEAVTVPPERIKVFDAETGRALGRGERAAGRSAA